MAFPSFNILCSLVNNISDDEVESDKQELEKIYQKLRNFSKTLLEAGKRIAVHTWHKETQLHEIFNFWIFSSVHPICKYSTLGYKQRLDKKYQNCCTGEFLSKKKIY